MRPQSASQQRPRRNLAGDAHTARPNTLTWVAAVAVAAAAAILLAPPASNYFWGVNGLRSLPLAQAAAVVLVALAASRLARFENRSALLRWTVAIAVSWALAFPLREKIHFLGDTQLRIRTLAMAGADWIPLFASWWSRLHANPLDIAVDILGVHALQSLGLSVIQAVSTVSWLLGIAFFAGCWRLAGVTAAGNSGRWGMTAALAVSGTLLAFAGYAESAGVVAVTAVWCWAELLSPLRDRRQAIRILAAFTALALAHRVGIVIAVALIARACGPAGERDTPAARRILLLGAIAAIATLAVIAFASGTALQLADDARDLSAAARSIHTHAGDFLNSLAVVAPLALLAPFAASGAVRDWLRSPAAPALILAAVPLLVILGVLYPSAAHHLGSFREWEAQILTGITLTTAAATILGRLEVSLRQAALSWLLPVQVLLAGGWLAASADVSVATRRAVLLAERPSSLTASQKGYLNDYLGQRAMDEAQAERGARYFEAAFDVSGNPRRALLACEAWLAAGDVAGARRALDKARARGELSPELSAAAARLDAAIAQTGRPVPDPTRVEP